jgi:hypothetical protein
MGLSETDIEDLKRRIVDRFHGGEDVSEDARKYADTSCGNLPECDDWFDIISRPETLDDLSEYLEIDRFRVDWVDWDDWEEVESYDERSGLSNEVYEEAVCYNQEYDAAEAKYLFQQDPMCRVYIFKISGSSGGTVCIGIRENPFFEWVEVTVHASSVNVMDHHRHLGHIRLGHISK